VAFIRFRNLKDWYQNEETDHYLNGFYNIDIVRLLLRTKWASYCESMGRHQHNQYYRGLTPFKAVVSVVTSSDHNPMRVTFRLADNT
jgi:hypothetical protein